MTPMPRIPHDALLAARDWFLWIATPIASTADSGKEKKFRHGNQAQARHFAETLCKS